MLIVFTGLPGCGKTTIAQLLSKKLSAVYIRVDEIEQAIKYSNVLRDDIGSVGYEVASYLARSNLNLGTMVIVDCVNPVFESREMFYQTGKETNSSVIDVEVVCSDPVEHRRRIEFRLADIPGHKVPEWDAIWEMEYTPWSSPRLIIDTAICSSDDALSKISDYLRLKSRSIT